MPFITAAVSHGAIDYHFLRIFVFCFKNHVNLRCRKNSMDYVGFHIHHGIWQSSIWYRFLVCSMSLYQIKVTSLTMRTSFINRRKSSIWKWITSYGFKVMPQAWYYECLSCLWAFNRIECSVLAGWFRMPKSKMTRIDSRQTNDDFMTDYFLIAYKGILVKEIP